MNSGIYILKWADCLYYYYGSSTDLKRRKRNHLNRLKNGKHENFIMSTIYRKYGLPEFEVVEFCAPARIQELEQLYLNKAKGDKNNINLVYSTIGIGRTFSAEQRNKISISLQGRKFSDTHLLNLKLANQGENNPSYGNIYGKNANAKRVVNITNGTVFESAKEIVDKGLVPYKYDTFKSILNGKIKTNTTGFRYCGEGSSVAEMQQSPSEKQELSNLITIKI